MEKKKKWKKTKFLRFRKKHTTFAKVIPPSGLMFSYASSHSGKILCGSLVSQLGENERRSARAFKG